MSSSSTMGAANSSEGRHFAMRSLAFAAVRASIRARSTDEVAVIATGPRSPDRSVRSSSQVAIQWPISNFPMRAASVVRAARSVRFEFHSTISCSPGAENSWRRVTIRAGACSCPLLRNQCEAIAEAVKEAWTGDGRQMRSAEGLRKAKVGNEK